MLDKLKNIKSFLTDDDGISITDYICLVITFIYLLIMVASVIYTLCWQDLNDFELRFSKLQTLLDILDDPLKIILTSYFVNGITGSLGDIKEIFKK